MWVVINVNDEHRIRTIRPYLAGGKSGNQSHTRRFLLQPNAGAPAILPNELDAGRLERGADGV